MRLTATVLDTPDPKGLALVYQRVLGWSVGSDQPEWMTSGRSPVPPVPARPVTFSGVRVRSRG